MSYTYLGYPALIYGLSRLRPRDVKRAPIEPKVSVVLAAHNEEARMGDKLENLLALDYPADQLEVIVVSDGSSDGTENIVKSFAGRGVILERLHEPSGKAVALNRGVARANGEIIVFCDARQDLDPQALRALMPWFADEDIGAVSGELQLKTDKGPGMYWAYEKLIRAAESKVDSVVGATGALYAIRRSLYRELPPNTLLDDVYTPMQIVLQGFRVGFEPDAKVFDEEASVKGEFSRKARTLAGNYQLLSQLPSLLDPRKNRLLLELVSHKLLRLACPFALAALLGSNTVLVLTGAPGWPLYATTLAGQLAGYGLALKAILGGDEKVGRLGRLAHTFVLLNAAAVEGLRRYLRGDLGWTGGR
ncbi:MAG: glycosyltransferase family 2 protein [Deltaproteobacteria bacterium]|nr:glycosyltransferase family 2 protein [Deltaproteobacteria bacterium]